jgi:hypothetical protein
VLLRLDGVICGIFVEGCNVGEIGVGNPCFSMIPDGGTVVKLFIKTHHM